MSEKKNSDSNSHLMYSEYMDINATRHAVSLIENNKRKPVMKFTKSPVLSRIMDLLPRMKDEEGIFQNSENDPNIEVFNEDKPFVEMDVAILKHLDENEENQDSPDEECLDAFDDEEESDTESCDSDSSSYEEFENSFNNTLDDKESVENVSPKSIVEIKEPHLSLKR